MFQKVPGIVSAVEFGTSKICVLVGRSDGAGHLEIIGSGQAPSAGCVVKGEITNMEAVQEPLAMALDDAGPMLNQSRMMTVLATGCDADYYDGLGTVFIGCDDHKVKNQDCETAHANARVHQLPPDHRIINSTVSYFQLDDRRRVRNPVGQIAHKLDAHVHVVHALTNRVGNFCAALADAGFDGGVEPVFSPLAAGAGILSSDESDNGVLLVDFGAGTTEYLAIHDAGVLASGVFQLGFEHVINDLAIAFELPVKFFRKAVEDGSLARGIASGEGLPAPAAGKKYYLPADSLEQVIELRIQEIFSLVREELAAKRLLSMLNAGGVLTGGGAKFELSGRIFREVFDCPMRIGQPMGAGGAVTGVEDPRYSALWGALKLANDYLGDDAGQRHSLEGILENVGGLFDHTVKIFSDVKKSLKI